MELRVRLFVFALVVCSARCSLAAFNYSSIGSTYYQNFDTLASSGRYHDWNNNVTIEGWYLFRVTAPGNSTPYPITGYDASDGLTTRTQFYSYGVDGDPDRALGGIGGGTFGNGDDQISTPSPNQICGWIAVSLLNNTGAILNDFTVSYDGEQWRDAGDNEPPYAQTMVLQYGFGADFGSVASWVSPGDTFDFTSPRFTKNEGEIDGNSTGLDTGLGGTISDISWQPGETLWIRWVEKNDLGLDHALAIDNFSFSSGVANLSAVPEVSTFVGFGLGLSFLVGVVWLGRRMGVNVLKTLG